MTDMCERHKEAAGSFAIMVWIGIGVYLFAVNDAASFVSWQGAIYFIGRMFASALVLGMASYAVRRVIAKILTKIFCSPSAGLAVMTRRIGMMLMIGEIVVIYYIAEWVITSILFP